MERRRVYHDSGGVRRTMITDSERPTEVVVHTEAIMDGVLDTNHEMRELHPRRSMNKLVARGIPVTIVERSMHEEWDEDDWKKWLNSTDAIPYRIWQGRV